MIRLQTLTDMMQSNSNSLTVFLYVNAVETAVYYNDQWICRECETEFWLDIREDFLKDVELCM